jgi:hypothetical protein
MESAVIKVHEVLTANNCSLLEEVSAFSFDHWVVTRKLKTTEV